METFDFTLILELEGDQLTEEMFEAFYEAGAADALIGQCTGISYADFSREAEDILEAVISAIHAIERAGVGARVVRIEPDDLVTIADIARRMGRTNESIRLLIRGERGPGDFPAPATRVGSGRSRIWRWADVVEWFRRYETNRNVGGATRYWSIIALVNDFLRQRTYFCRSDPTSIQVRDALEQKLGGAERPLAGARAPR